MDIYEVCFLSGFYIGGFITIIIDFIEDLIEIYKEERKSKEK